MIAKHINPSTANDIKLGRDGRCWRGKSRRSCLLFSESGTLPNTITPKGTTVNAKTNSWTHPIVIGNDLPLEKLSH